MIVFIVYLSTRSIVSKEGINDLFDEVSLSDVLIDKNGNYTEIGNKIKIELANYGVPEDVIEEVIDSEQVRDFFSDYAGDAARTVTNGSMSNGQRSGNGYARITRIS